MADVVLKNSSGEDVTYSGIETVALETEGGEVAEFTLGGSSSGVQPDYDQSDSTQTDYIKNRPISANETDVTWDGEATETYISGLGYLISELTPNKEAMVGQTMEMVLNDVAVSLNIWGIVTDASSFPEDAEAVIVDLKTLYGIDCGYIIGEANSGAGVYVLKAGSYVDANGDVLEISVSGIYATEKIETTDSETSTTTYSYFTKMTVPIAEVTGKYLSLFQPDWNNADESSPGFVKNKPWTFTGNGFTWDGTPTDVTGTLTGNDVLYRVSQYAPKAEDVLGGVVTVMVEGEEESIVIAHRVVDLSGSTPSDVASVMDYGLLVGDYNGLVAITADTQVIYITDAPRSINNMVFPGAGIYVAASSGTSYVSGMTWNGLDVTKEVEKQTPYWLDLSIMGSESFTSGQEIQISVEEANNIIESIKQGRPMFARATIMSSGIPIYVNAALNTICQKISDTIEIVLGIAEVMMGDLVKVPVIIYRGTASDGTTEAVMYIEEPILSIQSNEIDLSALTFTGTADEVTSTITESDYNNWSSYAADGLPVPITAFSKTITDTDGNSITFGSGGQVVFTKTTLTANSVTTETWSGGNIILTKTTASDSTVTYTVKIKLSM